MNLSSLLSMLPAKYAKFIAALVADLVAYIQIYGATWHLTPAVIFLAGALGIMGVPNKVAAPAPPPAAPTPAPAPAPPPATM